MRALRLAGASARERALLALEAWVGPKQRLLALLTFRSSAALRLAATRAGWLEGDRLEVPGASAEDLGRLERLAGLRAQSPD